MSDKNRKKRRLTPRQRTLAVLCGVLAAVLCVVLGFRFLFEEPELPTGDDPFGTEDPDGAGDPNTDGVMPKTEGRRKSNKYYTILILGRDTGGGGNTDTMLLASYDVTNQKATVMSIPRDTMVNVTWDSKKINSVYKNYGGGDKGIEAVCSEVSQLVGFRPDYKVVVEWEAVGAIVEAMGGVWFDVPYNMDYHDPYQDLVIEQAKGYRLLTGEDAMQVIRWRKNDPYSYYGYSGGIGDEGRMKLQQDFLKAVIAQLLQVENVAKIREFAQVFEQNVQTDLSFRNILWFGMQAVTGGLQVENVDFQTMPHTYASVYSRYYSERLGYSWYLDYVLPDPDKLLELVNGSISPYAEEFTLSDLDIMYVNADGSIGSTSGKVADEKAAQPPPPHKPKPTSEPPAAEVIPELPGGETEQPLPDVPAEPEPQSPAEPELPDIPEEPAAGAEEAGV